MTLSWPRLRCPRWRADEGVAVPVQDIRDLEERPRHDGRGISGWRWRRQQRERTRDLPDRLQRHARVDGGRLEFAMPEQHLDDADVGLLLEQVGREAVPERMHRDPLVELRGRRGGMTGAVELTRVVIGWAGCWPGKSQPRGRLTSHHRRRRSSNSGDSMT